MVDFSPAIDRKRFVSRHYGFESVFTEAGAQRDVNVGDIDVSTARLKAEFGGKL